MTAVLERPTETRACPECGEEITGYVSGATSAAFKMGTHRRVKHGVKGEGRTKPRGRPKIATPTAEEHAARPVISAVEEIAAEATGGKGKPTGAQLGAACSKGVRILSGGFADVLVDTDPLLRRQGPEADGERDWLSDHLTIPKVAADAIGQPIGRYIAGTSLNARAGRAIVDNVDVLAGVFELYRFAATMRDYLGQRRAILAELRKLNAQQATFTGAPLAPAPVTAPSSATGTVVDATMVTPARSATPPAGFVVGAEDVAHLSQNGSQP